MDYRTKYSRAWHDGLKRPPRDMHDYLTNHLLGGAAQRLRQFRAGAEADHKVGRRSPIPT